MQSPRKVGVGSSHACALGADRKVVCWGANYSGQLGFPPDRDGASVDEERATPVVVAGLPPVVDLVVGAYGACALTVGDDLWCWGSHPGGSADHSAPAPVRLR